MPKTNSKSCLYFHLYSYNWHSKAAWESYRQLSGFKSPNYRATFLVTRRSTPLWDYSVVSASGKAVLLSTFCLNFCVLSVFLRYWFYELTTLILQNFVSFRI